MNLKHKSQLYNKHLSLRTLFRNNYRNYKTASQRITRDPKNNDLINIELTFSNGEVRRARRDLEGYWEPVL